VLPALREGNMTSIQREADMRTQNWQVSGRRDFDHLIPIIRRHSRIVRVLRRAVPVAGFVGILWLLIAPALNKINFPKLPVRIGFVGTKIAMEVPHMTGVTRDGREYQVSEDAAAQDILKPDVLELSGVHGQFITKDNATLTLSAISGFTLRN
jgi:lipopolysaccharide export system protein LptC